MTRKKKALPLLERVTIADYAAEGKSVARVDDMVVFVPWGVPGDVVDLQVRRKKHSFMEAEIVNFHEYSNVRVTPFCRHFGICGGCKWQQIPYEEQLKMKQQQVKDQLTRIGKVELPEFRPILGSVKTQEYRNKLDFGCANKRYLTNEEIATLPHDESQSLKDQPAIGFHITGAFDKILPIEKCWLMDNLHNEIRNAVRDYATKNNLPFFDLRQQTGLLRDVIIRNSNTGEWLVIIQFHYDEEGDEQRAKGLLQHIADKFPQITALMYLDNQKCNDTIGDQEILTFKGNDHIIETMEGLRFKVGPKSFYQTNSGQALKLYTVAREFAELTGKEVVYDIYSGTGTIAQFVSGKAAKVIGIEYVPEAIEDAESNAAANGITNCEFFAGDMKDVLVPSFIEVHGHPDVIILDPPRAGIHPDVAKVILGAAPGRMVYVSCNPASQARDLAILCTKYRITAVQPVDMFPHTMHVENVVALELI